MTDDQPSTPEADRILEEADWEPPATLFERKDESTLDEEMYICLSEDLKEQYDDLYERFGCVARLQSAGKVKLHAHMHRAMIEMALDHQEELAERIGFCYNRGIRSAIEQSKDI